MIRWRGEAGLAGRAIHGLIALCASGAVLALLAFGYGPVPALGRALDPGHGAWASAAGGLPVRSRTLTLPGLAHPVSVAFTSHGVPSIRAAGQDDAFLALGYLHASFRLVEMDLERRLGEGRVAQLAGLPGWLLTSSSCASACCGPRSKSGRRCPGPARPPRRCSPTPAG